MASEMSVEQQMQIAGTMATEHMLQCRKCRDAEVGANAILCDTGRALYAAYLALKDAQEDASSPDQLTMESYGGTNKKDGGLPS